MWRHHVITFTINLFSIDNKMVIDVWRGVITGEICRTSACGVSNTY